MRKEKQSVGPRKLTDFFSGSLPGHSQNGTPHGAAALALQHVTFRAAAEDMDCSAPKGNKPRDSTKRTASSPHTSPSQQGPVSKKNLTYHRLQMMMMTPDFEQEQSVTLAALPTTDNPVSENMLKHMFLSLQKDLRRDK